MLAPILAILILYGARQVLPRASGVAATGSTYTVAAVRTGLARHPARWAGRVLRVRGVIAGCPGILRPDAPPLCQDWQPHLTDPTARLSQPLLVALAGRDPLLALLRRVPVLDGAAPRQQVVLWGAEATYRVQLRAMPTGSCPAPHCYEALLLDAAPTSH